MLITFCATVQVNPKIYKIQFVLLICSTFKIAIGNKCILRGKSEVYNIKQGERGEGARWGMRSTTQTLKDKKMV